MFDPTWPLFPTFAFLGFLLPLIPLPWHLHAWNSGTCYYIFWSSIGSLNLFVNAIVWRDTAVNLAPVWCDISTRISIGASVGIPAASLCINRRLYRIATVRSVTITRSEKRRAVLLDTLICIGIPVLCIALSYIVQGHRFNVWEQLGCYAAIYNTLPTFFLVDGWPIALGLISATYCVLSLKAFIKQQVAFNEFLSSHQGITISRYFRLMALSMTDIMCTIPLATYIIVLDVLEGVQPWISWANTHADFGRVDLFPAILWRSDRLTVLSVEFVRWSLAACGILFFLFFGFAEESRRHYRMAYHFIATRLGMRPADSGSRQVTSTRFP